MRSTSILPFLLGLTAVLSLSGCGYVHFGRYDAPATTNSALTEENTDLRVEKKILQQELALARKEGQALRAALESGNASGADQTELANRLRETTQELGTLRASYARLQAERGQLKNLTGNPQDNFAAAEQIAGLREQLGVVEGKLNQSTQQAAFLEQENAQLRREVSIVRQENATLEEQVLTLATQNEQAVAALSQLNTELLAQKTARQRAEDVARAKQTQLELVLANRSIPESSPSSLADARQSSAASASELEATLRIANNTAETASDATLRTSPERLRRLANEAQAATRYHHVVDGETLESIANQYYGKRNLWRIIYAANNELLRGGRPLKAGMKLVIPSE